MTRYSLPGILLALIMAACLVTFAEAAPAAPVDTVLTQPMEQLLLPGYGVMNGRMVTKPKKAIPFCKWMMAGGSTLVWWTASHLRRHCWIMKP